LKNLMHVLRLLQEVLPEMSIIDEITHDLDWRETELATMKRLIKQTNITQKQRRVLLRAAWAMLYAHYEGFAKFCLTVFYDEVSRRVACCETLPRKTKALALDTTVKKMRSMATEDLIQELETFVAVTLKSVPAFPDVDTESNLWPNTLARLCENADLSAEIVETHAMKIRTLVARRNQIAHGQADVINDVDYYLTFEEVVYEIMYSLVFMIDERLERHPYR
jgi:MAE_28990/MAE_18760-like HEPN